MEVYSRAGSPLPESHSWREAGCECRPEIGREEPALRKLVLSAMFWRKSA
jgi:hypothetical protein